jgi:hypothetical protein
MMYEKHSFFNSEGWLEFEHVEQPVVWCVFIVAINGI